MAMGIIDYLQFLRDDILTIKWLYLQMETTLASEIRKAESSRKVPHTTFVL